MPEYRGDRPRSYSNNGKFSSEEIPVRLTLVAAGPGLRCQCQLGQRPRREPLCSDAGTHYPETVPLKVDHVGTGAGPALKRRQVHGTQGRYVGTISAV